MRGGWLLLCLLSGSAAGCYGGTVPVAIPGFSTNPYKSRERAERRMANDLMPVELRVPEGAPPPRAYKMRVWVDGDYRRRPRWRSEAQGLVARASAYTEAAFGAHFEAEVEAWERSGDAPMETLLDA